MLNRCENRYELSVRRHRRCARSRIGQPVAIRTGVPPKTKRAAPARRKRRMNGSFVLASIAGDISSRTQNEEARLMANIIIRKLDDGMKTRLRVSTTPSPHFRPVAAASSAEDQCNLRCSAVLSDLSRRRSRTFRLVGSMVNARCSSTSPASRRGCGSKFRHSIARTVRI